MKSYVLIAMMLAVGFFGDVGLVHAAGDSEINVTNQGLALPEDGVTIFLYGLGATLILFGVASLGYLYRMNRGLSWDFQQSDPDYSAGEH